MIKPTIGRQVWYWSRDPKVLDKDTQPEAATVVYVWNDRNVNLQVINKNGISRSETSIQLRQPEDPVPDHGHCVWMPFQIGQAKAQEPPVDQVPLKT